MKTLHLIPKTINECRILRLLAFALLLSAGSLAVPAVGKEIKTLLVINSYDESELWANEMSRPIATYLSMIDSVDCEIVNLNCAIISDSLTYNSMSDNIFSQYRDNPPKYLVLIGNYAFLLRDRIKQEWGDIPILLFSHIPISQTLEDSFVNNDSFVEDVVGTPLESLRSKYNFTSVILPDNAGETVDLILHTLPNLKELMFFSTNIYVSRYAATQVRNKLREKRPDVKFTWVHADKKTSPIFRDNMTRRQKDKAMLLSTWVYERESIRGYPMLTSSDLQLIMSSKSPVFTLHESYRALGCIGGVFGDPERIENSVTNIVRQMLQGKSMRDIPFVYDTMKVARMNYRLLNEYGISEKQCPPNTVFYSKPESPLDKYFWPAIVTMLVLALLVIAFAWSASEKTMKLRRLKYNQQFLSNMPVPFSKADIHFDKNGNAVNISYRSKNTAFEKLIEENAVPDTPFLLFPPEYISKKVAEMMHKHQNVIFTYHFAKTDTYYEFILCSVSTQKEKYGTVNVVDIFATDLTNRYKMEANLRHFNQMLDMTLEVSRIVPWQWDIVRGVIIFSDRGMFQHLHSVQVSGSVYEKWEIHVRDFMEMVHPEDREKLVQLRLQIETGQDREKMHTLMRVYFNNSDEPDWIEAQCFVTEFNEEGHSMVATGSMAIVTDRIKADEVLVEALEKAKESDRMKSTFLANMSHEIRTPLNAIIGFSNLLAEGVTDAERTEFKEIINRNNELLLSLVNDVLDLAKIESNTIDIQTTPTDINSILSSVEQTVQFRLQKGVRLIVKPGKAQCMAEVDQTRLLQVLINLLTNACKFTAQGIITVGYEIREPELLYFYVKDTGTGIPPEGQEKVFEQFVKLNDFAQGTGLGLPICKSLVELMGGNIGVVSEGLNRGSCFWFTLPYKPCYVPSESSESEVLISEIESPITSSEGDEGEKPLVLVAEDNISNYMLLEHLMARDYTLMRAANGAEAVEMFKQSHPKFVLMDIGMPVMDGYEATQCIRKTNATVPIIAVTAFAYETDRQRILSSGFNGYVSKPISSKELQAAINAALGGGKTQNIK